MANYTQEQAEREERNAIEILRAFGCSEHTAIDLAEQHDVGTIAKACEYVEGKGDTIENAVGYLIGVLNTKRPQADAATIAPDPPAPATNVCNTDTMRQYAIRMARDLLGAEFDEMVSARLEAVDWNAAMPDELVDRVCLEHGLDDRKKSSWGLHRSKVRAASDLLVHAMPEMR